MVAKVSFNRKLTLVSVCTAVIVLFIIPWVGWITQMFRGRTIKCAGIVFTTPSRYFVHAKSDGEAWMWRWDVGVPVFPAAHGLIGIHQPHYGEKIRIRRDVNRIREILVAQEKVSGMNLDELRELDTNAGKFVCFRFSSAKNATVTCFFDNSTLGIRYDGSKKFSSDIYELLSSARKR